MANYLPPRNEIAGRELVPLFICMCATEDNIKIEITTPVRSSDYICPCRNMISLWSWIRPSISGFFCPSSDLLVWWYCLDFQKKNFMISLEKGVNHYFAWAIIVLTSIFDPYWINMWYSLYTQFWSKYSKNVCSKVLVVFRSIGTLISKQIVSLTA